MAFRGQHEHSLDAKDRITVPAGYRSALADGVVAIEGVETCVEVWPVKAAQAMEAQWLDPLSPMGAASRRMRRRFFATSEELELDSAGRIRIPKHLKEHATLAGPSLVVGVGDHLEIWNPEAWRAESAEFEAQAAELTEQLAEQAGAGGATPGAPAQAS